MSDRKLRRRRAAFAAGLATVALAMGTAAGPAGAAPALSYVALGDSFAAGQGAGSYLDSCYRSSLSYPADAIAKKTVRLAVNAACAGATTDVVVSTQLERLNKSVEVVTITAGGNNLDTTGLLADCTPDPTSLACLLGLQERSIVLAQASLDSGPLYQSLLTMVSTVKNKALDARVYVTGYPLLFHSPTVPAEVIANQLTLGLNLAIKNAVEDGGATYVDVAPAFFRHGIGSGEPWINGPGAGPIDAYHPNAAGYLAYNAALAEAGAYSTPTP
ncbi:SGNH/GDSL hydrolase family protein [Arthrobacter sp. LjRoot78]|uniref:SGNH/GDSL hydrolase family protein n=1 Tax=Arthrobacter sp. LjRoot78 TaxID=3342338 RepID=UPI003ECC5C61